MISKSLSTSQSFAKLHAIGLDPELAFFAGELYMLLIVHSDNFGRQPGDPFTVKHGVVPTLPVDEPMVSSALEALDRAGLVNWYEVGERKLLQILNFDEHQQGLHKRTKSYFPKSPGTSGKVPEIPGTSAKRRKKGASATLALTRFAHFWDVWVHKVGKKDAERVWLTLNPDYAMTGKLVTAVRRQIEDRAIAAKHQRWYPSWAYPATWLREERLNDELVYLGTDQDPTVVRPAEVLHVMEMDLRIVNSKLAHCLRDGSSYVELGPDSVVLHTGAWSELREFSNLLKRAIVELVGACKFTITKRD